MLVLEVYNRDKLRENQPKLLITGHIIAAWLWI